MSSLQYFSLRPCSHIATESITFENFKVYCPCPPFESRKQADRCLVEDHIGDSEEVLDPAHWPEIFRNIEAAFLDI